MGQNRPAGTTNHLVLFHKNYRLNFRSNNSLWPFNIDHIVPCILHYFIIRKLFSDFRSLLQGRKARHPFGGPVAPADGEKPGKADSSGASPLFLVPPRGGLAGSAKLLLTVLFSPRLAVPGTYVWTGRPATSSPMWLPHV